MPGICGRIERLEPSRGADIVAPMVERLRHDPAMPAGQCTFDGLPLTAGWAALAGSTAAAMPVWNEDRSVCLIFAGEEFSCSGETGAPSDRAASSPLRSLLSLYQKDGLAFLSQLNGCFSGLLIDLRRGLITLFNDRFGLGRIYYHESPGGFYFASEAKAILAVLPELRRIDQRGLAEFFVVGCVLQNRTLFRDIELLPPAAAWTFHRDGRVEKRRYFDPETWERQPTLDRAAYEERLTEVFSRIAPRYLKSTQRVAMSLTGGLDSRMLLAWAKTKPGELPCYTFNGPYRECADTAIARRLARLCQQPHTTIQIEPSFFREFGDLARNTIYYSDGTMDISGAVELYVNQRAKEIAPVRLTGNYGSEILRSNVAFRPRTVDTTLFTPEFRALIEAAAETYRQESGGHRLSFIAFKQVPWHHYARQAVEKSQLTPRSPFLDNDLVALAYQVPPNLVASAEPLLQLISNGNPRLRTVGTDRALRSRPLPVVTSMAKMWQEFTVRAEYAYDYGMPQWLVRADSMLKPLHVERLFLGRHKFYHFRVWYRDQLSSILQDGLFDETAAPGCYVDGAAKRLIREHVSGRFNRTLDLHKLLTVQLTEKLVK